MDCSFQQLSHWIVWVLICICFLGCINFNRLILCPINSLRTFLCMAISPTFSLICLRFGCLELLQNRSLGKRNLYEKIGGITKFEKNINKNYTSKLILNVLSFSDGKHSLSDISAICGITLFSLNKIIKLLKKYKLVQVTEYPL